MILAAKSVPKVSFQVIVSALHGIVTVRSSEFRTSVLIANVQLFTFAGYHVSSIFHRVSRICNRVRKICAEQEYFRSAVDYFACSHLY